MPAPSTRRLIAAASSSSLRPRSTRPMAHSGRELFFRSGDSLMTAAVALSPSFAVTGRRGLFAGSFVSGGNYREYDVAPDDQHFVMLSGGAGQSTLVGLQHVFDRLAPTR